MAGKSQERQEIEDMFLAMGYRQPNKIIDMVEKVLWDDLREEFIKALTVDSDHNDRRRRDFNTAIFDAERGYACFAGLNLGLVLAKYDQAVRRTRGQR